LKKEIERVHEEADKLRTEAKAKNQLKEEFEKFRQEKEKEVEKLKEAQKDLSQ